MALKPFGFFPPSVPEGVEPNSYFKPIHWVSRRTVLEGKWATPVQTRKGKRGPIRWGRIALSKGAPGQPAPASGANPVEPIILTSYEKSQGITPGLVSAFEAQFGSDSDSSMDWLLGSQKSSSTGTAKAPKAVKRPKKVCEVKQNGAWVHFPTPHRRRCNRVPVYKHERWVTQRVVHHTYYPKKNSGIFRAISTRLWEPFPKGEYSPELERTLFDVCSQIRAWVKLVNGLEHWFLHGGCEERFLKDLKVMRHYLCKSPRCIVQKFLLFVVSGSITACESVRIGFCDKNTSPVL